VTEPLGSDDGWGLSGAEEAQEKAAIRFCADGGAPKEHEENLTGESVEQQKLN